MKKIMSLLKTFIWAVVSIIAFSSCYTTKTEVYTVNDFPAFRKQCVGQTHNQIVSKLGAPQRQVSDGNGGSILIYETTKTTSVSNSLATAYNINYFTKTYTPGVNTTTQQTTTTDYVQYFINADNVCYDVKTNIPMTHKEKGNSYRKFSWFKTILLSEAILVGVVGAMVLVAEIIY